MAIQVINDPNRYGGLPQQQQQDNSFLGQLGQGVSRGLQTLAQNKLNQLQQRHAYSEIGSRLQGLGLSPQEADYLATLPPREQVGLLQMLGSSQQPAQQENFAQQLAPIQSQNQAEQFPVQENTTPQAVPKREKPTFLQSIGKPQTSQSGLTPAQERAEQHKINKETQGIYEQTFKEAKAATNSDKRLNRIEQLIKKGNLPSPGWGSLLKGLSKGIFGHGIDLNYLTHADAQEFDKLSTDFIKDAKAIFGARLTDQDLLNFLKTIPSLSQTNEGKLRVVNNLKAANAAAKIRENVMSQIIKANGGKRPADLESLIEEVSAPQIAMLADQFKEENIPKVEEALPFQLGGRRLTLSEELEAFRKNPTIQGLFFQQRD